MNLESGSFTRCVRHPSQIFTGFCSFCLAERLSTVGNVERSPKLSCGLSGDSELSHSVSDSGRMPHDARVRKTLLSLFHLDDEDKLVSDKREENATKDPFVMEQSNSGGARFSEIECQPEIRAFPCGNGSESVQDGISFDRGSWASEGRMEPDMKASSSCSTTVENSSVDTYVVKKSDSAGSGNMKQKGVSFWLGSVITRKALKWRMRSTFKKSLLPDRTQSGVLGDKHSETKPKYRHSCDWNLTNSSDKASWEDPRHSWDGSIMGKAFICSFACLEETDDGNLRSLSETDGPNPSTSQRRRKLMDESVLVDPKPLSVSTDVSVMEEDYLPPQSKVSKPLRDRFLEEPHKDIAVPGISRRISRRWSKVWNWSINSPFRDFAQKREHVLERSLSESWRECHQVKIVGSMESDSGLQFYGNGTSSYRANPAFNRNRNFGNGDLQSPRLDGKRNKREYQFGRSRSVHYSSPGNLENGLLRFYLTPLRSSRRNSNRVRTRTSRSFARGIFGLY